MAWLFCSEEQPGHERTRRAAALVFLGRLEEKKVYVRGLVPLALARHASSPPDLPRRAASTTLHYDYDFSSFRVARPLSCVGSSSKRPRRVTPVIEFRPQHNKTTSCFESWVGSLFLIHSRRGIS